MSLLGGETGHPGRGRTGLSCEIARTFNPSTSGVSTTHSHARWSLSHDWHVQPSCQRPKRLPPERRVSAGNPSPDPRPRSSTLQTSQNIGENLFTLSRLFAHCQPGEAVRNPEDFDSISPGRSTPSAELECACYDALPLPVPVPFGHPAQRKMKSEERSFGGSCDYRLNPSRIFVPEYKPRGRDRFQALPI